MEVIINKRGGKIEKVLKSLILKWIGLLDYLQQYLRKIQDKWKQNRI